MASAKNASLLSRQKVLDIIRGAHLGRGAVGESSDVVERKGLPTRAFALQRQHFASLWPSSFYGQQYDTPLSPADFHSILCERIEKASERIYLASLYVGPAVDPKLYRQEGQLLNSLAKATTQRQDVDVKILLDKSRGLRPVPIQHANDNTVTSITSAEACRQALTGRFFTTEESLTLTTNNNSDHDEGKNPKDHHSVYLHSVLSPLMQKILPNPLDEVAGVFHIKVYIIDDELILSGANLSQEYFTDRHDRYLHILKGGNGLVDWYAELVHLLCDYSEKYHGMSGPLEQGKPKKDLIVAVQKFLEAPPTSNDGTDIDMDTKDNNDIVAVACPTFQAPKRYGDNYRSDTNVMVDLLEKIKAAQNDDSYRIGLRVASAYLNLTGTFQHAWQSIDSLHCLTAGYLSHGFRPKKKAGNKGRTWIPAVFDTLSRQIGAPQTGVNVWYYTREDWTYHAKGLWLSSVLPCTTTERGARFAAEEDVVCVTHGSGNYGERSQCLDMESNLYLVLPVGSPLIEQHKEEWDTMCDHAIPVEKAEEQNLEWYIRLMLPWIKRFF